MSERTVTGDYVRWVSDDCYQTFRGSNLFVLPSLRGLAGMPMTNCSRPVRDDLFAEAKPDYLMSDEERAEAAQRFRRREQLRRATTGAVMKPAR